MMYYLRLVRYPNLLVLVLTMVAMRYGIIEPMLELRGYDIQLSLSLFCLLIFSTTCLTAAGYAINDYFDRKTDLINHPETVIVGKAIPRRQALAIHTLLNVLGVAAGLYLSYAIHTLWLAIIFVSVSAVLWLYSTTYKRQFLTGNLVVATLTAMVPMMVILFEVPLLRKAYNLMEAFTSSGIWVVFVWVTGYAGFAFLTTLSRELIKDAEDYKGDLEAGRRTLPVVWGLPATQKIINGLLVLTVALIVSILIWGLMFDTRGKVDIFNVLYVVLFLLLPLGYTTRLVRYAVGKPAFSKASMAMKLVMLAGVLFTIRVYFMMH